MEPNGGKESSVRAVKAAVGEYVCKISKLLENIRQKKMVQVCKDLRKCCWRMRLELKRRQNKQAICRSGVAQCNNHQGLFFGRFEEKKNTQ